MFSVSMEVVFLWIRWTKFWDSSLISITLRTKDLYDCNHAFCHVVHLANEIKNIYVIDLTALFFTALTIFFQLDSETHDTKSVDSESVVSTLVKCPPDAATSIHSHVIGSLLPQLHEILSKKATGEDLHKENKTVSTCRIFGYVSWLS